MSAVFPSESSRTGIVRPWGSRASRTASGVPEYAHPCNNAVSVQLLGRLPLTPCPSHKGVDKRPTGRLPRLPRPRKTGPSRSNGPEARPTLAARRVAPGRRNTAAACGGRRRFRPATPGGGSFSRVWAARTMTFGCVESKPATNHSRFVACGSRARTSRMASRSGVRQNAGAASGMRKPPCPLRRMKCQLARTLARSDRIHAARAADGESPDESGHYERLATSANGSIVNSPELWLVVTAFMRSGPRTRKAPMNRGTTNGRSRWRYQ